MECSPFCCGSGFQTIYNLGKFGVEIIPAETLKPLIRFNRLVIVNASSSLGQHNDIRKYLARFFPYFFNLMFFKFHVFSIDGKWSPDSIFSSRDSILLVILEEDHCSSQSFANWCFLAEFAVRLFHEFSCGLIINRPWSSKNRAGPCCKKLSSNTYDPF